MDSYSLLLFVLSAGSFITGILAIIKPTIFENNSVAFGGTAREFRRTRVILILAGIMFLANAIYLIIKQY